MDIRQLVGTSRHSSLVFEFETRFEIGNFLRWGQGKMTRSEREFPYFWLLDRVSLCFRFENQFKFQIVMLKWEGFAYDMEKFRGNLGRGKVNRTWCTFWILFYLLIVGSHISYIWVFKTIYFPHQMPKTQVTLFLRQKCTKHERALFGLCFLL